MTTNVRWQEEKAAKELAKEREQESGEEKKDEDKPQPNPQLEQGATLPAKMGDFPPEMFGLPIEDVDEYYFNKYVWKYRYSLLMQKWTFYASFIDLN